MTANQRAYRLDAIDLLRGVVIVIMALDHCRDYFMASAVQDPMAGASIAPGLFATRWITHFCAPVFVFLAGTSAGLMRARKTPRELGRFLLARGLWLLLVEVTLLTFAETFQWGGTAQVQGRHLVILQVLSALGVGMVALAGAQSLGRRACLAAGALIVLGHNLLDALWPASSLFQTGVPLWVALHAQLSVVAGPLQFIVAYPFLPWVGVMLLGFGASAVFELPLAQRQSVLVRSGLAMTAAFIVLRSIDAYGDPHHWGIQAQGPVATVCSFLNTTKYPPSLQFLLMTLGPAAIFCALAERMRGALKDAFVMFGRVPFAFYVGHFYVIHLLALALGAIQGFGLRQMATAFLWFPPGYGVSLPGVYLGWALVVALMFEPCRRVAALKARRRDAWLSYI